MNRERAKQLWPLIKLYSEGKEIQYRLNLPPMTNGDWVNDRCPDFHNNFLEFRVKPEAREWWFVGSQKFASKEDAMVFKHMGFTMCDEIIHMREVLDENS